MWPLATRDESSRARRKWMGSHPTTPPKKKSKRRRARKLESKKILSNIYSLPLDIKIKIYQMAVLINQDHWIDDFMRRSKYTLDFLSYPTAESKSCRRALHKSCGSSEWIKKGKTYKYKCKSICAKNYYCKQKQTITIPDNIHGEINCRKLSNDQYWYHKTCRCITCDRVRYIGRDYLSVPEKWKYSNIEWTNSSHQWSTKPNVLWPGQEILCFGARNEEW
jgi:hypothetical protein